MKKFHEKCLGSFENTLCVFGKWWLPLILFYRQPIISQKAARCMTLKRFKFCRDNDKLVVWSFLTLITFTHFSWKYPQQCDSQGQLLAYCSANRQPQQTKAQKNLSFTKQANNKKQMRKIKETTKFSPIHHSGKTPEDQITQANAAVRGWVNTRWHNLIFWFCDQKRLDLDVTNLESRGSYFGK